MNLSKDDLPSDLPEEKAALFTQASAAQSSLAEPSLAQASRAPEPPSAPHTQRQDAVPQLPLSARGLSLRRVLRLGRRVCAVFAGVATVSFLALYLLAQQALRDLAVSPGTTQAASGAGGVSVAAMHDGLTRVRIDGGRTMELGGHMAPVKVAEVVGSGAHVMTADATGHIRFTALGAAHGLGTAAFEGIGARFYDAVWRPYGKPIARWSLDWVAQVLPLYVPDSVKGGRGRVFRDCDQCPEMVEIEPGMFFMGSPLTEWGRSSGEGPRHLVSIPSRFAVGRFEVTFDEWDACVKAFGCNTRPDDKGWGRGRRPVISVSWDEVNEYLAWLSKKSGKPYRLLTEAEWEYAARAGTTTPFYAGQTITTELANFDGNFTYGGSAKGLSRQKTVDVGFFNPNALGLHDMHGNVMEWVEDCFQDSYGKSPANAQAATSEVCSSRVVRGGSWMSYSENLRSAVRVGYSADVRYFVLGFRVATTLAGQ